MYSEVKEWAIFLIWYSLKFRFLYNIDRVVTRYQLKSVGGQINNDFRWFTKPLVPVLANYI